MTMFSYNRIAQTVAPTEFPVDVDEAKLHMRIPATETVEDDYIETLIGAATAWSQGYAGRQLINATYAMTLDFFPVQIDLPRPPFSSLTSIQYVDLDGDTQTAASATYQVVSDNDRAYITEAYNQTWPDSRAQSEAVTVTYVAGYGVVGESVPPEFRQAILILVSTMYENRETLVVGTSAAKIPFAAKQLLDMDRVLVGV